MSAPASLDDCRWLVGGAAARWLDDPRLGVLDPLRAADRLRRDLSPARTHLVLEQIALRRRAEAKFSAAGRMFFTPLALAQASDELVAAYKAARFASGAAVADLCCGIGGDLVALAARGPALGVDRDAIAALLAQANCQMVAAAEAAGGGWQGQTIVADVADFDVGRCAAWHIDPDRRASGRRTTRVELHEPGPAAIERLLRQRSNAAVKLAPAATLPAEWSERGTREWISTHGECRQLVCWFGGLAASPGRRRATVLEPGQARTIDETGAGDPPLAVRLGRYVHEPDAAVLAAGLSGELAREHGLALVAPGVAYLTSDRPVLDLAVASFAIDEVLPLDVRRLRDALHARRIGRLEIKKRAVDVAPERLRRDLRLSGDQEAVLILTPLAGRPTAIVARRARAVEERLLPPVGRRSSL